MAFFVRSNQNWPTQICIWLLCFVVIPLSLSAQAARNIFPSDDWVSIEGPQLDRNDWERLRIMLASPVSADQKVALANLEESIKNAATTAKDPNVVPLLAQACLAPLQTQRAPGTGITPDYPLNRIHALRIAGLLGGPQSAAMLWNVLKLEIEPSALSEAWHSIRRILLQPTEAQIVVLSYHLRDPFPYAPNDALMQELLIVVKTFHATWNCMARKDIFDPILAISQNTRYLAATRNMALGVMKTLMNLN